MPVRRAVVIAVLAALVAPTSALLVGSSALKMRIAGKRIAAARTVAPRAEADEENSRDSRANKAAAWEALGEERRAAAADQDLSKEEVSALEEASKSKGSVWEGKMIDCPAPLKNALGTGSVDYFGQLRNPNKDPDPLTWEALRAKFPVLAGRSDEEVHAAPVLFARTATLLTPPLIFVVPIMAAPHCPRPYQGCLRRSPFLVIGAPRGKRASRCLSGEQLWPHSDESHRHASPLVPPLCVIRIRPRGRS